MLSKKANLFLAILVIAIAAAFVSKVREKKETAVKPVEVNVSGEKGMAGKVGADSDERGTAISETHPGSSEGGGFTQEGGNEEKRGTVLWDVPVIKGEILNMYWNTANETDNLGQVHKRCYLLRCSENAECTFYLNGKYNKLEITNISLPECAKNDECGNYIEFYGDGQLIDATDVFSSGSYPQDALLLDVEGVKELRVVTYTKETYGSSLIADSVMLY